ncbi:toxin-antitoxin system YwqK family antitoxin [Zobellia laminariae]|uniref:toxin-antitoxin system YwqK family antitoxin n=1 Tax=Zobellia laminariae TaxID=248906 RepID=UPI0012D8AD5D|nr:nicotinic acid mononucleotide adenyltransferase [Zobellia laminariae]MUH39344.1 nicotinic acid mononucleotide adenyltransferase [Zobellia laminariae]WKX78126.1 nicotinic acid mononucleotide adenyltransferase [Zobellia laminariae]
MKNSIILFALALTMTVGYAQKEKEVKLNKETNLVEATYYHDNGAVSQTGTFDLAGKLHGQWISFDEAGEKVSKGNYNKGVRTGKWFFYNDGAVKEVEFDNNVIANVIEKQKKSAVVSKN